MRVVSRVGRESVVRYNQIRGTPHPTTASSPPCRIDATVRGCHNLTWSPSSDSKTTEFLGNCLTTKTWLHLLLFHARHPIHYTVQGMATEQSKLFQNPNYWRLTPWKHSNQSSLVKVTFFSGPKYKELLLTVTTPTAIPSLEKYPSPNNPWN